MFFYSISCPVDGTYLVVVEDAGDSLWDGLGAFADVDWDPAGAVDSLHIGLKLLKKNHETCL